ncbi:hypothetical protein H0H87_009261 [Tephrocybe sp. NHM501043]|nr:hypothetical protein H0H87_009261 [Tephrocybe sp. NHM501043]
MLSPERGRFLKSLSLANFKDLWKKDSEDGNSDTEELFSPVEGWLAKGMEALLTILKLLTAIQHLQLLGVKAFTNELLRTLAQLTEVERLSISSANAASMSLFTLDNILHSVTNWTKLNQITVSGWGETDDDA